MNVTSFVKEADWILENQPYGHIWHILGVKCDILILLVF